MLDADIVIQQGTPGLHHRPVLNIQTIYSSMYLSSEKENFDQTWVWIGIGPCPWPWRRPSAYLVLRSGYLGSRENAMDIMDNCQTQHLTRGWRRRPRCWWCSRWPACPPPGLWSLIPPAGPLSCCCQGLTWDNECKHFFYLFSPFKTMKTGHWPEVE